MKRRTAIVLVGVAASGTERRMAYVFTHLRRRYPGEYLLVINRELLAILEQAGFGLGAGPDVHVLTGRSRLDVKRGAHSGVVVNAGRVLTLFRRRSSFRSGTALTTSDSTRCRRSAWSRLPVASSPSRTRC